ncbi:MAG: RNA pseudouridine synthase [Proteobacteria bacterium]|nr:RNA pseudouridine synthase [Pseudomonadota bacterium]
MRTLDKPGGIPVFPPHHNPDGDCLLQRILQNEPHRRDMAWPQGFAGGIAHRLDTATSGAVLVADNPEELTLIRQHFNEGQLLKTYRLLASKDVSWNENGVVLPIAHDRRRKNRMVVQRGRSTPHRGSWHEAETRFRRLSGLLFEAQMKTGVMHQIRAHAAFVGIPLMGDHIYGSAHKGSVHLLHHVGLVGGTVKTEPVPLPNWAKEAASQEGGVDCPSSSRPQQ